MVGMENDHVVTWHGILLKIVSIFRASCGLLKSLFAMDMLHVLGSILNEYFDSNLQFWILRATKSQLLHSSLELWISSQIWEDRATFAVLNQLNTNMQVWGSKSSLFGRHL